MKNGILQKPNEKLNKLSEKVISLADAKNIAQELIEVTRKIDKPWSIWLGTAAPQIGYTKELLF